MIPYVEDFLSMREADSLQEFVLSLTPVRPRNPRNQKAFIRKVSYGCYSVLPESRTGMTVHGGGAAWLSTAPDEIKSLVARLTAYAGTEINYLSILGYENELDHIGFHQHREDRTLKDQSVHVISLGDVRTLTVRPVGCKDKNQYEHLDPAHGSLYVLPHEYNTTHEHAVLDSKVPCGLRIPSYMAVSAFFSKISASWPSSGYVLRPMLAMSCRSCRSNLCDAVTAVRIFLAVIPASDGCLISERSTTNSSPPRRLTVGDEANTHQPTPGASLYIASSSRNVALEALQPISDRSDGATECPFCCIWQDASAHL